MLSRGRQVFLALSMATLMLVAGGRMLAEQKRQSEDGEDSLFKYLAVFSEVLSLVDRAYVDELEDDTLMGGALEGTLDALDPFTLFVPADRVESFAASREAALRRSGMLVLKERGVVYIAAVDAGSPAAEAGLARDHIISSIQGRRTRNMGLDEILTVLSGEPGTEIELERIYQGQKENVRFELAEYEPPSLELSTERGVAVLKVPSLRSVKAADVEALLSAITVPSTELPELDDGGKLVIDLRGASGGAAEVAYELAALFTSGELGALLAPAGDVTTFEGGETSVWQGEIVVLLDRGTQGAAEVLATVLHQSVEATLVGDRSFGHSGRQKWVDLSTGARLQITDAFYTGPDREPINQGLQPDEWIRPRLADDDSEKDEILERGLDILLLEEEEPEEQQAA